MYLRITGDSNEESGVGEVISELSGPTRKSFETKEYGVSVHGICAVLMCRNPDLKFKKRLRFSKKDKMLYMDVMLDLKQMCDATHENRKQIIVERLITEILIVLRKYKFPEFDDVNFIKDLKEWLQKV